MTATILKQLRRIPRKDAERIHLTITLMAFNPFAGDTSKMQGEQSVWRRRVGAYRIFFEIQDAPRTVYVYQVKRRTSTTY